jgi:hypothetical protein
MRQLPAIAQALGKSVFKRYIEHFIEPMHYSLCSEHFACSAGATACAQELAKLIGPNIFMGRVEQYNPDFLQTFIDATRHGTVTARGHTPGAPFGARGLPGSPMGASGRPGGY